jgi:DNA-binding transcriptional MerR regulator
MTVSAINFYVREGVLPPPKKTARTRALYDESYVELLSRIRELKSRGLPLRAIAIVLSSDDPAGALGIAAARTGQRPTEPLDRAGFLDATGLTTEQIDSALDLGLIEPSLRGRGERAMRFDTRDVSAGRAIAGLVAAGAGFELLARHTAEFEPLTRAESHFLAEHLAATQAGDKDARPMQETANRFARLRDYLRLRKLEDEYSDWLGRE